MSFVSALLGLVLLSVPPIPALTIPALTIPALTVPALTVPALTVPALAAPARKPVVIAAGGFGWPLNGAPQVVRRFDPPPQPWQAGHRGVDLAADPGSTVRAAGAGVVVYAGRIAGRGVVSVAHADGLRTTYEPVDVDAALQAGHPVTAGEVIGALAAGHPGCPAGACLHWGLRRGDSYLDPLALLGLAQVRLLPLQAQRNAASSAGRRSARRSYSSRRL